MFSALTLEQRLVAHKMVEILENRQALFRLIYSYVNEGNAVGLVSISSLLGIAFYLFLTMREIGISVSPALVR